MKHEKENKKEKKNKPEKLTKAQSNALKRKYKTPTDVLNGLIAGKETFGKLNAKINAGDYGEEYKEIMLEGLHLYSMFLLSNNSHSKLIQINKKLNNGGV